MKAPVTQVCRFCGRSAARDPNRIGNWHAACARKARMRAHRELGSIRRRTFET